MFRPISFALLLAVVTAGGCSSRTPGNSSEPSARADQSRSPAGTTKANGLGDPSKAAQPHEETKPAASTNAANAVALAPVTITERLALRAHSPLVNDGYNTFGYKLPSESGARGGDAPKEPLAPERAKELALSIATRYCNVEPGELRFREAYPIFRAQDAGWHIAYEQTFRSAALYRGPAWRRKPHVYGVDVTIFTEDDWDLVVHLVDVTVAGTARPVLGREQALALARKGLHIPEAKPHDVTYCDLTYYARPDNPARLVATWMIAISLPLELDKITSYMWAHTGGEVVVDAHTGEIVAGDPLRPDWPKDPDYWDKQQRAAADWSHLPPELGQVVAKIKLGMSEDEVDELLQAVASKKATLHGGGSGWFVNYYTIGTVNYYLSVHFGGMTGPQELILKVTHVDSVERERGEPRCIQSLDWKLMSEEDGGTPWDF